MTGCRSFRHSVFCLHRGHAFETNSFRQVTSARGPGSWFNKLSQSEAASASFLDISAVSKEINNVEWERRKPKRAMLRESDFKERTRIILHRWILHCPKRVPPCSCFVEVRFSPLLTTAKTCASLNPRCGTRSLFFFFFFFFGEARRFPFVLPIVYHV